MSYDKSTSSILAPLLAKARAGDSAARDELFTRCRSYVNLVARTQVESWMRQKVDASDLVQQTMLEAYRGFPQFDGGTEGEWLAWLRKILSHNTQDFIRRMRTEKRGGAKEVPLQAGSDSEGFFHDPASPDETPSQMLSGREREIALAQAIERLPEDYQEVILLRNLQRLPFDDVAERMGRTRGAVQMLWARAIQKLTDELGSEST
ncbi:ECF RNA polymerase sigma factor SigD [Caulifigura coniformis]|uniref:ECF RNA polymerase sigma factor SigD n=1 Tax=Caulifigura coniformis TaxID=2527983 RepID=A0A517SFW8_9PLAN|nr:sigma-70 family RNA polymerase sigma factor [Caulifigura coniformis]QDT55019.1 ECF RNA polymerase sigma factor SigD [Caulifigura coniformis]